MGHRLMVCCAVLAALQGGQVHAQIAASKPSDTAPAKGLATPEAVDGAGSQQFQKLLASAAEKKTLAPPDHPQLVRLNRQLQRVLSLPLQDRLPRVAQWQWQVALIEADEASAFSMSSGKLVVYTGLLSRLQPSDDELAALVATLAARLLLDQPREIMTRSATLQLGAEVTARMVGISPEQARVGSDFQLQALKRQQVLAADGLARKLLDELGVSRAAQVGLIERTMALLPGAAGAAGDFPRLEARLAQVLGAGEGKGRSSVPPEPIQQLRHFAEAYTAVKDGHVEPVDDKKLMNACLNGMLSGLDPDSAYLDSDAFQELAASRDFAGVGLELGVEDGRPKVVAPIEGSPSDRAGILRGDVIVGIDDAPTKGMPVVEAVKRLRGQPGTQVNVTVTRRNEAKPLAFVLKREVVKVPSVKSRMLAPDYALVRVTQFQDQTGAALARKLQELYKESRLKGLVLDLRNNPGGLFNAGIGVASAFLPTKSLVVSTSGRTEDSRRSYLAVPADYSRSSRDDYLANLPPETKTVPMVVLVNGGSAAASEIVAGALQDHRRATVLGSPTFGRASIQTLLPLPDKAAIKLTTARWHTPNGRSVQSKGIVPDIVVSERQGEGASTASGDDPLLAQALALLKESRGE